jgi:quercetin dioxygenase-like cupin family protein
MTIRLTLYEDKIAPGMKLACPALPRVVYVRWGLLQATTTAGTRPLSIETATLWNEALTLSGDGEAWSFELSPEPVAAMREAGKSRVIMAHDIDRDPREPVLFRTDRVEFPPGTVTPKHGHKGPGIRRVLYGRIIATIGDEVRRLDAGDPWFETGKDPVVGASAAPTTAFIRAMALDPALKGQPTFIPWSNEEAAKPRGTGRREFFDEIVRLPV